MKRLFILSMPTIVLTILLVSKPQPKAGGQPFVYRDSVKAKTDTIQLDASDLHEALDSNKQVIAEIRQVVKELSRKKRTHQTKVVRSDTVIHFINPNPDTITVCIQVPTRDTSLDHKTWWGRFFAMNRKLLKQCKMHTLFKGKKKS